MKAKTARNTSIAQAVISGISQKDVAKGYGLDQSQVSRILKTDEAKALIDEAVQHNILQLPVALERHDNLILSIDEAIALKAIDLRYKVMGISTPHPPVSVLNIYQNNQIISYSPHIQAIIEQQVDDSIDGEIIEEK